MLITKTSNGLKILSPAKVNLYLNVTGKRNDGFHNIESVMQTISLYDVIYLRPIKKGIELKTNHPALSNNHNNLAYQAADLIKTKYQVSKGVQISLIKKIPIGGGLGGGSSNAAAVLLGLNRLWRLNLSQEELSHLSRSIGSDVPFFIYGQTALVMGRGEIVFPLKTNLKLNYIVLTPNITIPTKNVYKNLKLPPAPTPTNELWEMVSGLTGSRPKHENIQRLLYNKLEKTALKLYPTLRNAYEYFSRISRSKILLSGSGSSIFTMYSEKKWAEKIRAMLASNNAGKTFTAKTLN